MEEKKFDPYQFIGFILIAMILTWMLFRNENSNILNSNQSDSVSKIKVLAPSVNASFG